MSPQSPRSRSCPRTHSPNGLAFRSVHFATGSRARGSQTAQPLVATCEGLDTTAPPCPASAGPSGIWVTPLISAAGSDPASRRSRIFSVRTLARILIVSNALYSVSAIAAAGRSSAMVAPPNLPSMAHSPACSRRASSTLASGGTRTAFSCSFNCLPWQSMMMSQALRPFSSFAAGPPRPQAWRPPIPRHLAPLPPLQASTWNGVQRRSFVTALGSAPCFNRLCTTSGLPIQPAMCRLVQFSFLVPRLESPPAFNNISTIFGFSSS